MQPRLMRARLIMSFATVLALTVGGCGNDGPLGLDDSIPPPVRNTTDPVVLVLAHAEALSTMDLDRYAALLEQPVGRADVGFEYIPRDEDVDDFGWIPESGWGYTVETGIMAHMMDPDFASAETGNSVKSISAHLTVTNERAIDGGGVEVTCNADITVLWAENDGARTDVRFLITMFPGGDEFLRIRAIAELPPFGPRAEDSSWSTIKGLYR